MQIHELNNFTGTLGSGAYLAIDDGTDTGKISSQGLLAATEARIDNIIAGPAPSAEEIVDARLGADGVTYPSLGDAIRDQFTDVKAEFNYNSWDYLREVATYTDRTSGGVSFTWSDGACSVVGTANDNTAFTNLYYDETSLINGLEQGASYPIKVKVSDTNIKLAILFYNGSSWGNEMRYTRNNILDVPSDAVGMIVRVKVLNGDTANGTISNIAILTTETNEYLYAQLNNRTKDIENLSEHNSFDFLKQNAVYTNRTASGITYTWSADKTECAISGTATATSFNNLYHSTSALPSGMQSGKTYLLKLKITDANINIRFIWYDSNGSTISFPYPQFYFKGDSAFTVPPTAVGMTIRFHIGNGYTVSGKAYDMAILTAKGNAEITDQLYPYNNADLLPLFDIKEESKTRNGVTFTWDDAHEVCTVSGTSTGVAFSLLYSNVAVLPPSLKADKVYYVQFDTNTNVIIEMLFYKADSSYVAEYCYSSKWVHIPSDTVGLIMRIRVFKNVSASGTISNIHLYKMAKEPIKVPLIFSVVDDDTTSTEFVRKFYQNCKHNGIQGDYAVVTKQLDDGLTSADNLLQYEQDGFGMLTHCYYQNGSQTPWWSSDANNYADKINDIAKCLRSMREYGFINYMYWIAPSGLHNGTMQKISRQVGFRCIAGAGFNNHNYLNIDRYYIQRISLGENDEGDNSVDGVKTKIDACISEGCGWIIIMTHFNEWENSSNTWDSTLDANGYEVGYSRFNEVVQYALSKGMRNVTFAEGFSYIEPNILT